MYDAMYETAGRNIYALNHTAFPNDFIACADVKLISRRNGPERLQTNYLLQ